MTKTELITAVREMPIGQLLSMRGLKARNDGRGWACPVCEDTKQNGIIRKDPRGWYCHNCQTGGTAVDLWLLWEGCDPKRIGDREIEALERLAGGTVTPWVEPVKRERPGLTVAQVCAYWCALTREPLRARQSVLEWLRMARGIDYYDPIRPFHVVGRPAAIPFQRPDIRAAVEAGPCAVFPLMSTHPDRCGQVRNLVIRPINPTVCDPGEVKPWKAKCLNWGQGSTRDGEYPLIYGDPVGALDARVLVIVEGALDQLTAEALSDGMYGVRVVGAFCADDLWAVWPTWLKEFRGERIVMVTHLDKPTKRQPGGEGWHAMHAMASLLAPSPDWFPWVDVLAGMGSSINAYRGAGLSDLNDLVRRDIDGPRVPWADMRKIWTDILCAT